MKQKGKMMIDLIMTVMLLCQMGYMLVGETLHEWVGTAMFLLFIVHHILNRRWYGGLQRGRYTPYRIMQILINILLLVSMAALMVSGIVMSRVVFAFLPLQGGMALARVVHMLASYWGFILMSVHLGMHWGMVMGMIRKFLGANGREQSRGPEGSYFAFWRRLFLCMESMVLCTSISRIICSCAASLFFLILSNPCFYFLQNTSL